MEGKNVIEVPPGQEIRRTGLASIITDRVMMTMGYHLRTEKNRQKIFKAVLYEIERGEVIIPEGTDVR